MVYVFGDCELDTRQRALRRANHTIALSPKIFQVLCYLLTHHDRIISKQELCEQIWPNQFISDAALESAMRMVRQSVGDSGQQQRVIQTRRGHGYRMGVTVTLRPDSTGESPPSLPSSLAPLPEPSCQELEARTCDNTQWAQALAHYRHVGAQALTNAAYSQAVGAFEQALTALEQLSHSPAQQQQAMDLQLSMSHALLAMGKLQRAIETLEGLEPVAEAMDDGRRLGHVCTVLALAYWLAGDYQHALSLGRRALAIAKLLDDFAPRVQATLVVGQVYLAVGEYARAEECFGQNVAVLQDELDESALAIPWPPLVLSHACFAWSCAERGAFPEAQVHWEEAIRVAEKRACPVSRAVAYGSAGAVLLMLGDVSPALIWLERALSLCQCAAQPLWFAWMTAWRGEAYLRAGQIAEALACAERAWTCARERQERGSEAQALWLRGEIAAQQGPSACGQAVAAYTEAQEIAATLGMRPLLARCHLSLGGLYERTGQGEEARLALLAAVTLCRGMGMTCGLHHAEAALARVG